MPSTYEHRPVIVMQQETRGCVSDAWLVYGLIFVVASALRAYHLDGQLWFDEISALRGYRKSFVEILTTFPPYFPNPLYELMAHLGIVTLGENALAIRLPSGCHLRFLASPECWCSIVLLVAVWSRQKLS